MSCSCLTLKRDRRCRVEEHTPTEDLDLSILKWIEEPTHPVEDPDLSVLRGPGHAVAVVVEEDALLLGVAPE